MLNRRFIASALFLLLFLPTLPLIVLRLRKSSILAIMLTPAKNKLTDDQAAMLAYLAKLGLFQNEDLFEFFSEKELWSQDHKIRVFTELINFRLIAVDEVRREELEGWNTNLHVKDLHLTDEAKALLEYYEAEQQEIKERKQLEHRKLQLDVKNAEFVNTTFWWTFGLALGAFLISLVLAVVEIARATD